MKNKLAAFGLTALSIFTLSPSLGLGEEPPPIFLFGDEPSGLVLHAKLATSDQVSGGCWTNSDKITSEIRLKLEQNQIAVLTYEPEYTSESTPFISITAVGYKAGSICTASAEFSVSYPSWSFSIGRSKQKYYVQHLAEVFSKRSIISSGSSLNGQLDDFFAGASAEFIADIVSSRRSEKVQSVLADLPFLNTPPPEKKSE